MIRKLSLLSLAFGIALCNSDAIIAQDIDNNDLYFTYIQLPLSPIKSTKSYQASVIQKFEDVIKTKTDLYNQDLAKSEEEFKKAMEAHTLLQKMEDDKYAAAMTAWNKKPKAEQILYANQFPQRTVIPMPTKREVLPPDLPKTYDTQLLAGKYIRLEGFNNTNDNPVNISVSLYGFNSEPPVVKDRVSQKATAATGTIPAKPEIRKYYYEIRYKHMMSYKMEVAGQGVITEQFPAELDTYSEFKTTEYDSISTLERNWPLNKAKTMEQIQDKVVYDNLAYITSLINDKYGYVRVKYGTLLSVVDEKKDYQDYKEAYVAAENGYKLITESANKSAAYPELDKAIGLWENAMKQSQPNNKKARVDGDVTEITILNLIEAYIWKDDYINAKAWIDKLKTLDPSRKGKRRLEGYEALLKRNKTRFDANQ
ncbi:MAG: hypothetical protein K0S33_490 [Bacteroidetes bacterium]|jgi:hypothetical protein|nr:hypothetical protein [Bacteroidota bacterium]